MFLLTVCVPIDVVLVLPTSADPPSFQYLKTFLTTALGTIDVGGSAATLQVAVVKYRGRLLFAVPFFY